MKVTEKVAIDVDILVVVVLLGLIVLEPADERCAIEAWLRARQSGPAGRLTKHPPQPLGWDECRRPKLGWRWHRVWLALRWTQHAQTWLPSKTFHLRQCASMARG